MPPAQTNLLQGTLDLLILKALSWGPRHGYGIADWIEHATGTEMLVGEGTLYPALHRLEARELVEAEWGLSENNRRAKYYRLTAAGRRQLAAEQANWLAFAGAMTRVFEIEPATA